MRHQAVEVAASTTLLLMVACDYNSSNNSRVVTTYWAKLKTNKTNDQWRTKAGWKTPVVQFDSCHTHTSLIAVINFSGVLCAHCDTLPIINFIQPNLVFLFICLPTCVSLVGYALVTWLNSNFTRLPSTKLLITYIE